MRVSVRDAGGFWVNYYFLTMDRELEGVSKLMSKQVDLSQNIDRATIYVVLNELPDVTSQADRSDLLMQFESTIYDTEGPDRGGMGMMDFID